MRSVTKCFQLPNEQATLNLGEKLGQFCQPPLCIYLQGNLGAGKTCLVRGILRGMGYTDRVKSPSYSLLESYLIHNIKIYHFDLYRLNQVEQTAELGIQDYLETSAIQIIEWPEHGAGWLPKPDLTCYIEYMQQGRKLQLISHTTIGEKILKHINS